MQCPHCRLTMQDRPEMAGRVVECPGCSGQFVAASAAFDPYYTWLGIPAVQQPPDFYRLLGLQLFEPNLQVIENAADRQMLHVRSYQMGPHAPQSQKLLNEIATARVTLLDPPKKQQYDSQLGCTLAPLAATSYPQLPAAVIPPSARPTSAIAASALPASASRRARNASNGWTAIAMSVLVVAGGVLGLALGVLIVFYATGRDVLGWSARLQSRPEKEAQVADAKSNRLPSTEAPTLQPALAIQPYGLPPQPAAEFRPALSPVLGSAPQDLPAQTLPDFGIPRPPRPAPLQERVVEAQDPQTLLPVVRELPPWVTLPNPLSTEPATLAALPGDKADPIQLSLHSAFAALPERAQLVGQPEPDGETLTINYVSADGMMQKTPLAVLRRDGADLKFQWADSPLDGAIRRQLGNCVVGVLTGGRPRKMQLREPLPASPLILDLYDDNKDLEFQIDDLPKTSHLRLKSLALDDFPSGTGIRGAVKELEFNKSIFIDFQQMRGAQVRVRLLQQPKTKALLIKAEPTIKENANREYEMTLTGFEKLEIAQRRALVEATARRTQLQNALREAQSSLRWLMDNQPTTAAQLPAWNTRVTAAKADIGSMPGKIAKTNAQIAETQTRLNSIPDVRNFINTLNKRAAIHYALCAVDSDHELVLIANP